MFWLITLAVITVLLMVLGWFGRRHRLDPDRLHRNLAINDSRDYGPPGGGGGGGGGGGSGD